MSELINIFRKWNTRFTEDPALLAGLVIAALIQGVWRWRPLVSITGAKESGKTTLLSFISDLLAPLSMLRDGKVTEAGLRQEVQRDLRIILLDEFEINKHRDALLQLFRTCGAGGTVTRGTSDHHPIHFGLRHIVFTGSIDSALRHSADRSRFLVLELMPIPPETRGDPVRLNRVDMDRLAEDLKALALWAAPQALELSKRLSAVQVSNLSGRGVENLACAFSVLGTIEGGTFDQVEERLKKYGEAYAIAEAGLDEEGDDGDRLLSAIASVVIRISDSEDGTYKELSVGQLIQMSKHASALEARGLKLKKSTRQVFICPPILGRYLGSDWEGVNTARVLSRIGGCDRGRSRIGGRQNRGFWVPLARLLGDDAPPAQVTENVTS